MKTQNKLIAAAALALSTLPLPAQDKPTPPQRPAASLFEMLDANKDGSVDSAEIDKAAEALRKMDRNGDGKIAPDEFHLPRRKNAETNENPERRPERAQSSEAERPDSPRTHKDRPEGEHRHRNFHRPEGPQSQRGPERGGFHRQSRGYRDMQYGQSFQRPPFHEQRPPMGPPPRGFQGQQRGPRDMNQGPQQFQRPPFGEPRPPMGPPPEASQGPRRDMHQGPSESHRGPQFQRPSFDGPKPPMGPRPGDFQGPRPDHRDMQRGPERFHRGPQSQAPMPPEGAPFPPEEHGPRREFGPQFPV